MDKIEPCTHYKVRYQGMFELPIEKLFNTEDSARTWIMQVGKGKNCELFKCVHGKNKERLVI